MTYSSGTQLKFKKNGELKKTREEIKNEIWATVFYIVAITMFLYCVFAPSN